MTNSHYSVVQKTNPNNKLTTSIESPLTTKYTSTNKDFLVKSILAIDEFLNNLSNYVNNRLDVTRQDKNLLLPRIIRLCERFQFNETEKNIFHLMVVVQGSSNAHVLNALVEEDYLRRMIGFQRLARVSDVGIDLFCDSTRLHIKEGVVLADEEHGTNFNLRCPRTVVLLLYGLEACEEDLLKVSQTSLEEILEEEPAETTQGSIAAVRRVPKKRVLSPASCDGPADKRLRPWETAVTGAVEEDEDTEEGVEEGVEERVEEESEGTGDGSAPSGLLPYSGGGSQLEYLEDGFQLVALMVRGNAARLKEDMKKEGSRMNSYDSGGGYDSSVKARELTAKLRVIELRMQRRVAASELSQVPRLESLAARLRLDTFEKKLLLLLVGKTVSPVVKTLMETLTDGSSRVVDDVVTVGQALAILCQDFHAQISHRKYFYRSGRLMSHGLISLGKSRWHQGSGDLTDNRISLDRRVLDWVVGLDSEINELVEGSDLYTPTVPLSQVVLPPGHLQALLAQCRAYDDFLTFRANTRLKDVLSYGNSLVIMLCGKSGTGKTMTVNAIAHDLKKKVLLVDFVSLTGGRKGEAAGGSDMEADLRGLFREAQLNNAVLFFDECEVMFRSRGSGGGDRLLNSLLTEIEKHEGVVFLATNRPYEMDEAMHRRITAVVEYRPPDARMRRDIWSNLLAGLAVSAGSDSASPIAGAARLADDVDVAALAAKYELTGGFIKNAVLSALLCAISRDALQPQLRQADLMQGCKLQMRGSMTERAFEDKQLSQFSLSDLHLSPPLLAAAKAVLRFEQSRILVYGSWTCTAGPHLGRQAACLVALAGPAGSGKKTFMSAVCRELGRETKLLHVAELLRESADSLQQLSLALQDARLADSVLAIDGFEHLLDGSMGGGEGAGSVWKLHLLLSRILGLLHAFPGCVFLLCHVDQPQLLTLQRDLATKLFSFVRFGLPPHDLRAKLWRSLLPAAAPLAADISFADLGRRFELTPGGIQAATSRAAAEAACRPAPLLCQADLLAAGRIEEDKTKSAGFEIASKLFA